MDQQFTVEDRQLSLSCTNGIYNLIDANWDRSSAPSEEFLAVLALRVVLAGYLIGSVTKTDTESGARISVAIDTFTTSASQERVVAARALFTPVAVYADMADIPYREEQSDVGVLPIPLLIIGGAVSVAATIAHSYLFIQVAKNVSAIVDGVLRRNDAAKEIQRADGEVLKYVNSHVLREKEAGQILPLDEATKEAIGGLNARISALTSTAYQPNVTSNSDTTETPKWQIGLALAGAFAVGAIGYAIGKKKE